VVAVYPTELTQIGGIQLVSFDNQPNDMATLASARRGGMDYLLQGNIVREDLDLPPPDTKKRWFRLFKAKEKVESLTVHWSIVDVESGQRIREKTITVDRNQADKDNPELTFLAQNGDARVLAASARQSWSFVAPTTERTEAMLDLPWFSPGSSLVRKGNAYAKQGDWDRAEQEWQQAADQHSWNQAAWKNLSLAAVAREDFQLARDRLKHADTFLPGDSTFPTLKWIEQRQRSYHQALNLPPPEQGWTLPDPPKPVRPDEVPSSPPKNEEELPWWTRIPAFPGTERTGTE
jgi:tetratricopeptide (TPR) repeat protein